MNDVEDYRLKSTTVVTYNGPELEWIVADMLFGNPTYMGSLASQPNEGQNTKQ